MHNIEVIHGNCQEVMSKMEPDSIDLIIADPPYGGILDADWDDIDDYYSFSMSWLREAKRILKPTGSIYSWCSIGAKSSSLLTIASIMKQLFVFQDMIVWAKQRGRGNRRGWLFTREEILWSTKTKDYIWNKNAQYSNEKYHESWIKRLGREDRPFKRLTNVWKDILEVSIKSVNGSGAGDRKPLHKAQKPVESMQRIIASHTKPGDLVLDPFAGSGTTGVACKMMSRNCILIENDINCIDKMALPVRIFSKSSVGQISFLPDGKWQRNCWLSPTGMFQSHTGAFFPNEGRLNPMCHKGLPRQTIEPPLEAQDPLSARNPASIPR